MTRKDKPFVVACIPAFNEEATIAKIVIKAMEYVDKVIVCDDGSTDMTGVIAERLGAEVIRHDRNIGYGAALASLFERTHEVRPDIVVTLDADEQHDPKYIPALIDPIVNEEADVVIGSRFLKRDKIVVPSTARKKGIEIITALTKNISYREITDAQSGFRAYKLDVLKLILPSEMGMGASTEILLKAKENSLRVAEVPIRIRYEGTTKRSIFYQGLDVIFSTIKYLSIRHPLIFYGVPGLVAFLISIVFWIWTLQMYAVKRQLITNVALMAIASTIVGLLLMSTAIIIWVLVSILRERIK